MKFAFFAAAALFALGIAYSLGPDISRYMKIKSM